MKVDLSDTGLRAVFREILERPHGTDAGRRRGRHVGGESGDDRDLQQEPVVRADCGLGISDCGLREGPMEPTELKRRTKAFSLNVIQLVDSLPRAKATEVIGWQLVRSATSVGANYRAACRARSQAEFVSRIGVVEEEADESMYWLELLLEVHPDSSEMVKKLLSEADELTAIFAASGKTARNSARARNPQSAIRNPQFARALNLSISQSPTRRLS